MTNNDISIFCGKTENTNSHDVCPSCADIVGKFLISLIIFWLTAYYFSDKLFDIQSYIEDHGLEFKNIEIFMIILLLITFYFISKLLLSAFLYLYNLFYQQNKCKDNADLQLIASILFSIIYIFFASNYFTSILAPTGNIQKEMLKQTIFWWLICILILNVLLNSSRIQDRIIDRISNITCGIFIYPPWNFIKGKLRSVANSVRRKNDQ
jgi:hypothetical protein